MVYLKIGIMVVNMSPFLSKSSCRHLPQKIKIESLQVGLRVPELCGYWVRFVGLCIVSDNMAIIFYHVNLTRR